MAENTKRSVFSLHGITGALIATVLLLSILAFLTVSAIKVQQASATNPYDPTAIKDINNLKMNSVDNKQFAFQKKDN